MARKQYDVNLATPDAFADPYPHYDQIRDVGNIVWNDFMQGWMAVGYEEVNSVVANQDGDRFVLINGDPEIITWFEAPNILTVDGPQHRKFRDALRSQFTRSAVAGWEQRVGEVVDDLFNPLVADKSSFDLIADFTQVPTIIVAEMLGVPKAYHGDFVRWSQEIVANLSWGMEEPERRVVMNRAAKEVNAYFKEEIARHRKEQPDDLLTMMLNLPDELAMTEEEIQSTAVLLLLAGYDTTAKTMTGALVALEANPDQRRIVANDLSLVPAAIEESMRWGGAIQWGPRKAVVDVTIDGSDVAAGDMMYVFWAAANRDPRRWVNPNTFDVNRPKLSHMGFGHGPHVCLGAPLARLEVKVALERLLQVAPEYELRDLDFGNPSFIRGPEQGVVAMSPAVP